MKTKIALRQAIGFERMGHVALSPFILPHDASVSTGGLVRPPRMAGRLCHNYDLDLFVVLTIQAYLHRIDACDFQVQSLQASSGD